jgi:hypothetical protein
MAFYLLKIATLGVFLWHFHVYMYILKPELVYLSFPSFCLSSLIMVISTGLKILYSFLYREYINHIHLHREVGTGIAYIYDVEINLWDNTSLLNNRHIFVYNVIRKVTRKKLIYYRQCLKYNYTMISWK